jgi:hypothetical protein
MAKQNPFAQPAPHSWAIGDWPPFIYPNDPRKGRYLVRANRTALVEAGALIRVGRDLVVLGAGFSKWLAAQSDRVDGFEIAPNRPAEAA